MDFALGLSLQVLAALDFIHAREIIHRDIKPANIFLSHAPQSSAKVPRVKLSDFGATSESPR